MDSTQSQGVGIHTGEARAFLKKNLSPAFLISYGAFETLYVVDVVLTYLGAGGDHTAEANVLARLWWEVMGPLRFVEVPIWSGLVFGTALILYSRSSLLGIAWLIFLACQHLFGILTWLPYGTLNFLYQLPDWASGYGISIMSACIALPLSLAIGFLRGHNSRAV